MADVYTLVVPFLTDDPTFARGVEFGLLFARMQHGSEDVIEDYFTRENQDQILLLASRLKWQVTLLEDCQWPEWFHCRLERPGESFRA